MTESSGRSHTKRNKTSELPGEWGIRNSRMTLVPTTKGEGGQMKMLLEMRKKQKNPIEGGMGFTFSLTGLVKKMEVLTESVVE
jgi:hypothetical protein